MYIVDGIDTRNTITKLKNNGTYFALGCILMLAASRAKKNACIQSIYRGTSGALRYSNEMRCFGMHGDRGAAQKKREKK